MKKSHFLALTFIISALLIANLAKAEDESTWEAQVQAGAAFVHTEDTTFDVTTKETDTLVTENDPTAFHGSVGLGYVFLFEDECDCNDLAWFSTLKPALNFYFISEMHFKGDVYQYEEAILDNYDYRMDVESQRLMLDFSTDVLKWRRWAITALAGLGVAWNETEYHDFANFLPGEPDRLKLDTHTQTQFAWEVGAGLRYQMTERFSVSLDYLYADLGKAKTGDSIDETFITHPEVTSADFRIRTNSILLGLQMDI